jgi:hypothetical protein
MERAVESFKKAASPDALKLVQTFNLVGKLLSPIPSLGLRNSIAHRLIHAQLIDMGYEVLIRDVDSAGLDAWKMIKMPFRYSRIHPW